MSVDGMTPGELDTELFAKYKIHCPSINWENIKVVRIKPHVYTPIKDIEKLVRALEKIATCKAKS